MAAQKVRKVNRNIIAHTFNIVLSFKCELGSNTLVGTCNMLRFDSYSNDLDDFY